MLVRYEQDRVSIRLSVSHGSRRNILFALPVVVI